MNITLKNFVGKLNFVGVDIEVKELSENLRAQGYLSKDLRTRNIPTEKSMKLNLFEIKESLSKSGNRSIKNREVLVTEVGQNYLLEKMKGGEL